jgi:hypothetical protein
MHILKIIIIIIGYTLNNFTSHVTISSYILKQQCLSVCVGSAWKILPVTAHSLWCLSVCGDKQGKAGQGGQGSRCGGPGEVPFLLKKSLGKTGGHASNQTKIQF